MLLWQVGKAKNSWQIEHIPSSLRVCTRRVKINPNIELFGDSELTLRESVSLVLDEDAVKTVTST
jgi:hypothetical protein